MESSWASIYQSRFLSQTLWAVASFPHSLASRVGCSLTGNTRSRRRCISLDHYNVWSSSLDWNNLKPARHTGLFLGRAAREAALHGSRPGSSGYHISSTHPSRTISFKWQNSTVDRGGLSYSNLCYSWNCLY